MTLNGKELAQSIAEQTALDAAFLLITVDDCDESVYYAAVSLQPGNVLGYDAIENCLFEQEQTTGEHINVFDFYDEVNINVGKTSVVYSSTAQYGTCVEVAVHASVDSVLDDIIALAQRKHNGLSVKQLVDLLSVFVDEDGTMGIGETIVRHHLMHRPGS